MHAKDATGIEFTPSETAMSADSDLLFAQADAFVITDLGHLPEYEGFTKHLLLGSAIDGAWASELLLDLEVKNNVPMLSLGEFNDFNTFSMIEEEEGGEKDDVGMDMEPTIQLSSLCQKEVQSPSPKTAIATAELNCLNLNDLIAAGPVLRMSLEPDHLDDRLPMVDAPTLQASPLAINIATQSISSTSPVSLASPSETLPARVLTQGFISSTSSIANASSAINGSSPVSSRSTLTSSDGSCSVGTETSLLSVSHLVNGGDVIEEDDINSAQRNSSARQSASVAPLTDCTSAIGGNTPRLNVLGNGHGPTPSIQRSHSSHDLGQLTSAAHTRAFYDLRISTVPKHEANISELSTPGEFKKPHLADLQEMNVRPSITSIRRVYSTGDLQGFNGEQICYRCSSPLPVELPNVEEGCMRIGHYTSEERRMKLHRYRQKRTERNFNKKIKYVCRKTLADSRPRIRGRFARSDDVAESGFKPNEMQHDDEDGEISVEP